MRRILIALCLWCATSCHSVMAQQIEKSRTDSVILFVCEHGSVKSVVAAFHFNRLAKERNLRYTAISRGVNPDSIVPQIIIDKLQDDGFVANGLKPKKLAISDTMGVSRIVSFCALPNDFHSTESWDGVAPLTKEYDKGRRDIVIRITRFLDELDKK